MEFPFNVTSLFPQVITRSVGGRLTAGSRECNDDNFAVVVNEMGVASAKAQGLRAPITTFQKLRASNQIIYIMRGDGGQRGSVVGILKVGHKKLFLSDMLGLQHEVEPLCVLDFYVHESRQRSGCGKILFEAMMRFEEVKPFEVAIDRPSPKFLGFLKKHYQLSLFVKQANNFVVFEQFFTTCKEVGPQCHRFTHTQATRHSPHITQGTNPPPHLTPVTSRRRSLERTDQVDLFGSGPRRDHNHSLTHTPVKITKTPLNKQPLYINREPTEFTWNTEPLTAKRTLNSNLSPHSKENEFNIITGRRKLDDNLHANQSGHYGNSETKTLSFKSQKERLSGVEMSLVKNVKLTHSDHHDVPNKAPHLNMRQNSKGRALYGGANLRQFNDSDMYRAFSASHVTSHVTDSAKYSRHGPERVGGSLPQLTNRRTDESSSKKSVPGSSLSRYAATMGHTHSNFKQ